MSRTILVKPVITEKMTLLQEEKNQYAFLVERNATKIDIKNAIQKKFNVKVDSVRTLIRKGKSKSQLSRKGRNTGFKSDAKRAIITLAKDSKIDLFGTA